MSTLAKLSAEHPVQVVVGEDPGRVEPVAHGQEVVELRVGRAQRVRVAVVQLAPVRPAAQRLADRLDGPEVRLVRRAGELVHGDVGGVPAVAVREPDVVRAGEPHLDRELHLERQPSMIRGSAASTRAGPRAGISYSISVNCTRRGVQKTRSDRSV